MIVSFISRGEKSNSLTAFYIGDSATISKIR